MSAFDMPTMIEELRRDEGVVLKPYRDTVGKLTLGVGRNLDDVGIDDDEANYLLQNDIARASAALDDHLPWWETLDPVRQRALVNACFNMGIASLMTFTNTLSALQSGDYDAAADGILNSKYAKQVGQRAVRIANMIRTGSA